MSNEIERVDEQSLSSLLAAQYHVPRKDFLDNIKATCMPSASTTADLMTFLMVCHKYGLNPMIREVYAFPRKGDKGGIQVIVGVDGWMRMVSSNKDFDGVEFFPVMQGEKAIGMTCKMYKKGLRMPVEVTEYLSECRRNTEPWNQWPMRMIRHKSYIQAARVAFGITEMIDQDEYDRGEHVIFSQEVRKAPERATISMADIKAGNANKHTAVEVPHSEPTTTDAEEPPSPLIPYDEEIKPEAPKPRGRPRKQAEPAAAKPVASAPDQKPAPAKAEPAPAKPVAPPPEVATDRTIMQEDIKIVAVVAMNGMIRLATETGDVYYSLDMKAKEVFETLCNDKMPVTVSYYVDKGRCVITEFDM